METEKTEIESTKERKKRMEKKSVLEVSEKKKKRGNSLEVIKERDRR